jgi:O-antigen ligase
VTAVDATASQLSTVSPRSSQAPQVWDRPQTIYFILLIAFLVVEYVRPYPIILFKPQMVLLIGFPLAWLIHQRRPWHVLLTLQLVYVTWGAIAVPLAQNNYWAFVTLRIFYGNFVVAVVMVWLLVDRERFRVAVWCFVAILGYAAIYALGHAGHGPGGAIGDENDTAVACCIGLAFCLGGFESLRGRGRWLCLVLAILFVATSVATASRGGFVGLVAVLGYGFWTTRHKLRNFFLLVTAALAFFALVPDEYVEDLKTIQKTDEGTANTRKFLWAAATNMWKAHPITGVGGWNFNWIVQDYIPLDFPVKSERERRHYFDRHWGGKTTHSLYFQMLAEQGLLGCSVFAMLVFYHFRTLRRLRKDVRSDPDVPDDVRRDVEMFGSALGGAMIGFLAAGAFVSVAYYPFPWYFAGLAAALDLGTRQVLLERRRDGACDGLAPVTSVTRVS